MLGPDCGTNINSALASTTAPIGNGSMWLSGSPGTYTPGVGTAYGSCSASSLTALILSDPTHTYKIEGYGMDLGNWGQGSADSPGTLRNLPGGVAANVEVGRSGPESQIARTYVRFVDEDSYTGTTTINPNASIWAMSYGGGNGLGGGGNITINGPGEDLYGNGSYISMGIRGVVNYGYMINKGNLTFNGGVGIAIQEGASGSWNNYYGTSIAR